MVPYDWSFVSEISPILANIYRCPVICLAQHVCYQVILELFQTFVPTDLPWTGACIFIRVLQFVLPCGLTSQWQTLSEEVLVLSSFQSSIIINWSFNLAVGIPKEFKVYMTRNVVVVVVVFHWFGVCNQKIEAWKFLQRKIECLLMLIRCQF